MKHALVALSAVLFLFCSSSSSFAQEARDAKDAGRKPSEQVTLSSSRVGQQDSCAWARTKGVLGAAESTVFGLVTMPISIAGDFLFGWIRGMTHGEWFPMTRKSATLLTEGPSRYNAITDVPCASKVQAKILPETIVPNVSPEQEVAAAGSAK